MCHTYLTTKFSENQVNSIAFAIILRTNKKQTNKHWWKHNLLGRGNKQWSYLNEWDYNDQALRCFLKVQQCQGKLSICCTDEAYLMSKRTETGSWSRTGSSGPRLGLRLWPLIGHVWVPSDDCWSLSLISTTTLSANKQISAPPSIFTELSCLDYCNTVSAGVHTATKGFYVPRHSRLNYFWIG